MCVSRRFTAEREYLSDEMNERGVYGGKVTVWCYANGGDFVSGASKWKKVPTFE